VAKYHESNCLDKNLLATIDRAVNSSIQLRSKKELIQGFIERINTPATVEEDWHVFVSEQKEKDISAIIADEQLKPEVTRKYVDRSLQDGVLKTTGTEFDRILPPVTRFGGGERAKKKLSVIEKLMKFFEKYIGLG